MATITGWSAEATSKQKLLAGIAGHVCPRVRVVVTVESHWAGKRCVPGGITSKPVHNWCIPCAHSEQQAAAAAWKQCTSCSSHICRAPTTTPHNYPSSVGACCAFCLCGCAAVLSVCAAVQEDGSEIQSMCHASFQTRCATQCTNLPETVAALRVQQQSIKPGVCVDPGVAVGALCWPWQGGNAGLQ